MDKRMALIELLGLISVTQESESQKLSAGRQGAAPGVSAALPAPAEQGSDSPDPRPTTLGVPPRRLAVFPPVLSRPKGGGRTYRSSLRPAASGSASVNSCPAVRPCFPAASEERSEPCSVADTPAKSAHGDTYVCGVLIHNSPPLKKRI